MNFSIIFFLWAEKPLAYLIFKDTIYCFWFVQAQREQEGEKPAKKSATGPTHWMDGRQLCAPEDSFSGPCMRWQACTGVGM